MTNFCLPQPSFVPVKNNLKKDGTSYAACIEPKLKHALQSMDYGHTMAKSQILCGPNSNPNPQKIFGMWI